mgnify:CR=1 FL=1
MSQLVWEPSDLTSILGVVPAVGEHESSHQYVVVQGPVRLQITIWQYDDVPPYLSSTKLWSPIPP